MQITKLLNKNGYTPAPSRELDGQHMIIKCFESQVWRLSTYLEQIKVQQRIPVLVLGYFKYAVDVIISVFTNVIWPERAAKIIAVKLWHLPLCTLRPVSEHDSLRRRLMQIGRRPCGVWLDGWIVRGGGQQPDASVQRPLLRPRHGDHHPIVRILQLRYGRRQRCFRQIGSVDCQQTVTYMYSTCPVSESTYINATFEEAS